MNKFIRYTYNCSFKSPYTQAGKVRKYLKVLIAMMNNKPKTRKEILKIMGSHTQGTRGQCSCMFADMQSAKLKGYMNGWLQGENYAEYMQWVTQKLLQDKKLRVKYPELQKIFKTISKKYINNSVNFIINK